MSKDISKSLGSYLLESYSVAYNRTPKLFSNPNDFKVFFYIFSQYHRQLNTGQQNKCLINMSRNVIKEDTNIKSLTTVKDSVNRLVELDVIKPTNNKTYFTFNAPYVMGVIATLNACTGKDVSVVADAFEKNDIHKLQNLGYKPLYNFEQATVSAISEPKSDIDKQYDQILVQYNESQAENQKLVLELNEERKQSQKLVLLLAEQNQNLYLNDKKDQKMALHGTQKDQILVLSDEESQKLVLFKDIVGIDNEEEPEIGLLYDNFCDSLMILSIILDNIKGNYGIYGDKKEAVEKSMEIVENIAKSTENDINKKTRFWSLESQILAFLSQILVFGEPDFGSLLIKRIIRIKRINRKHVLFEKNENSFNWHKCLKELEDLLGSERSDLKELIRTISELIKITEQTSSEIENDYETDENGYDEFDEDEFGNRYLDTYDDTDLRGLRVRNLTYDQYMQLQRDKCQEPEIRNLVSALKDELGDYTQIDKKEFQALFDALVLEVFSMEWVDPETDELMIVGYDEWFFLMSEKLSHLLDDRDWEDKVDPAIQETLSRVGMLHSFALDKMKYYFPQLEELNRDSYHIAWRPEDKRNDLVLEKEFKEMHANYKNHRFTAEELALSEPERKEIMLEKFEELIPIDKELETSYVGELLRDLMVDAGVFMLNGQRYSSKTLLKALRGIYTLRYHDGGYKCTREVYRSDVDIFNEDNDAEKAGKLPKYFRASLSPVMSLSFNYKDALVGWKCPVPRINGDGTMAVSPIIHSALKYLGKRNGDSVLDWEIDEIIHAVEERCKAIHGITAKVQKYTTEAFEIRRTPVGTRYNITGLDDDIEDVEYTPVPSQDDNKSDETDEVDPEAYVPRPRARKRGKRI